MLKIIRSMRELAFSQLMEVYHEGNQENGQLRYPNLSDGLQLIHVHQDFYTYLSQIFFKTKDAVYYVWVEEGKYLAALRTEPYRDGILIAALETEPSFRRFGYATRLLQAVISTCDDINIYSHVSKQNTTSLRVHLKCGFEIISDTAVYLDGSISRKAYTLCVKTLRD